MTVARVKTSPPGRYGDGNGLYLLVRPGGTKFWVFRYTRVGRMREMGLGRAGTDAAAVTLAEARTKAGDLHKAVKAGGDPLAEREDAIVAAAAEAQETAIRATTFRTVADRYLAAHAETWRNPVHRKQWRTTLDAYVHPHMGDLPVGNVGVEHVLAALEPIWRTKPETATRVRGRIETVLDYATARAWRTGENPARWRGHLANLLPARSKVAAVKHHAALPWKEISAFLVALRAQSGIAGRALEFTILTASRSGEVLGARWGEVDLLAKVWAVPAVRMKAGREHRVPLAGAALLVLGAIAKLRTGDSPDAFVFPGPQLTRPLSNMAMAMVLRRMKRGDLTVHGFRSTFRDWVGDATGTPREVAEAALAHVVGSKTEAAYARGDLFEKRQHLMEDWSGFCARVADMDDSIKPLRREVVG